MKEVSKKIRSTLAFVFTADYQHVLLIRKNKPEFHKGKFNGLGGKCEGNETATECVSREVNEEASLDIAPETWRQITVLQWQEWYVDVFAVVYHGQKEDIQSNGSEEIKWFPVNDLPKEILTNLSWLIPLSIDVLTNPQPPDVHTVQYQDS